MMASLPGENVPAAAVTEGNQPLASRDENGVKVFEGCRFCASDASVGLPQ